MRVQFCRTFWGAFLACLCLLLLTPLTSYADGGAPNRAYVAGTIQGISVIDIAQQQVLNSLPAQGDPHEVLLSLDGRFLYVTQPQQGDLALLSAATGATICKAAIPGQPTLLALDTNSSTLYVAGNGSSSVSAVDSGTCHLKRSLQADGPVYGLALATSGTTNTGSSSDQIWVATTTHLEIFRESDAHKVSSIVVPGGAQYLSIPPGSAAYLTTRQGSVVAVSLTTHEFTPLLAGGTYEPMDFDEQTGEIFVPDARHRQLDVLAPITPGFPPPKEPERTIALASPPNSVAITSDGQFGFVAMQGGSVAMLDIPGRQLVTTFHVGGNPQFIITGLNPPVIGTTPQQATLVSWFLPLAAYILIGVLVIVPILVLRRRPTKAKVMKEQKHGNE
jgi:DNA-binding beta-propeller fold protein YncE